MLVKATAPGVAVAGCQPPSDTPLQTSLPPRRAADPTGAAQVAGGCGMRVATVRGSRCWAALGCAVLGCAGLRAGCTSPKAAV